MLDGKTGNKRNIIVGFAIFGFLLSILSGIIGRVLFGIIILRAFLFAAVFAGIGLGIIVLTERFIPELLSDEPPEDDSEKSESSDIIEEDTGLEAVSNGRTLDITIDDDENDALDDSIEELKSADQGETPEKDNSEPEELSSVDDVEEAEPVSDVDSVDIEKEIETEYSEQQPAAAEKSEAAPNADGNLPDIGVFADSFDAHSGVVGSDGLSNIDGGGPGSTEILGGMHETQEIVKAVQTVLKKDQEG